MCNITFNERNKQYLEQLAEGMAEYLIKEEKVVFQKATIENTLRYTFRKLYEKQRLDNVVTVHRNKNSYVISKWQILYVERDKRDTYIYLGGAGDPLKVSDKLDDVDRWICGETFVRCHNSFIVNLNYIAQYSKTSFLMKNGAEIPISRSHQKEVKEKFLIWESQSRF